MNSTEMMERFRRFASADLSVITPNRMHQISEILLETGSVRVIITRHMGQTEHLDVDVEVSLPPLPEGLDRAALQDSMDTAIANLDYLKCLISIGFDIEILREEGIVIASASLSRNTSEHVFEVIRPPD